MPVNDEVDRVSETRLLESCSTPAKLPLGCAHSDALVNFNDVIVLSEADQVVPDVENKKDKARREGVQQRRRGF